MASQRVQFTLSQAAKIASLSIENFLDMLGEFNIPAVDYPAEDLETELEDLG